MVLMIYLYTTIFSLSKNIFFEYQHMGESLQDFEADFLWKVRILRLTFCGKSATKS